MHEKSPITKLYAYELAKITIIIEAYQYNTRLENPIEIVNKTAIK